jgi:hypothetical protein
MPGFLILGQELGGYHHQKGPGPKGPKGGVPDHTCFPVSQHKP